MNPQQRRPVKRAFPGLAGSPLAQVTETQELREQREKEEAQAAANTAVEEATIQQMVDMNEMSRKGSVSRPPKDSSSPKRRGRPRKPSGSKSAAERKRKSRAGKAAVQLQESINTALQESQKESSETRGRARTETVSSNTVLKAYVRANRSQLLGPPGSEPSLEEGARRRGQLGGIRGEGRGRGSRTDEDGDARKEPLEKEDQFGRGNWSASPSRPSSNKKLTFDLAYEARITWTDLEGNPQSTLGYFSGELPALNCKFCKLDSGLEVVVQTWDEACAHLRQIHQEDLQAYLEQQTGYAQDGKKSNPVKLCPPEDHERIRKELAADGESGAQCALCKQWITTELS